jgi:hypothetical protein
MASIKGIKGLTGKEINRELAHGAKFVVYQYSISVVVMSFRRSSNIHFVKSNESGMADKMLFTAISLLFGWWGIPWGPIYTVGSIYTNLSGGKNVTGEVLQLINAQATEEDK